MALDIYRQFLMLILVLARPLDKMYVHHALTQRPLHIKPKSHVLGAPLVRLGRAANEAVAGPARP
jgi:hypothetical protein